MTAPIVTQGLVKRYGRKVALAGLDLEVPAGAIYALLGENGAGKSTTLKALAGQHPPDGGSATVLGHDPWAKAVALRHRVGYVAERPRFYDWMTVDEIGWFVSRFHKPGFQDRYRAAVTRFSLDAGAKLGTLSKGSYAKVGLALALAPDPEVLLLDEPTSGLDLLVRREFLASMIDLAGTGRTILISSHQVAELERVASHVAFLAGGKLLLSGSLDDVRQKLVKVTLRGDGELPDPARLGTVLSRNGNGRAYEAVLRDPNRDALQRIGTEAALEEAPLSLEEAYTALLGHKPE